MAKELSTKNTKNEILDAYNELAAKMKEQKPLDRKTEKIKEDELKVIESAKSNTPGTIVKSLGEMKLEVVNVLDILGDRLLTEHKKLTDLQQSIEIETKHFHELYEINVNAESLTVLLHAQQEKKQSFDKEMEEKKKAFEEEINQKKLLWKQEQENYDIQKKERDAQVKKDRQREEEEYNYALQLKRKKDTDQYETRKAELEKDLETRKAQIAVQEKEFSELKSKVELFPAELERTIQETEKSVSERLELKYKHQTELSSKDIESERKLNKQIIASLENKIKEQEELMKHLTQKANEAGTQIQSIAIKAIEGASGQRFFGAVHEKTSETGKS